MMKKLSEYQTSALLAAYRNEGADSGKLQPIRPLTVQQHAELNQLQTAGLVTRPSQAEAVWNITDAGRERAKNLE